MRRAEKAVTDELKILEIIGKAPVCFLGLSDDDMPYVVPLNFGFEGKTLYAHCALEGKKLDIIRRNNRICVAIVGEEMVCGAEKACKWDSRYESVMIFGAAYIVEDVAEKVKGLKILMKHYSNRNYELTESMVSAVAVIRVDVESITGKRSI